MNKISEFVNVKYPSLNVVCGEVGCGKSTYLENMAEEAKKAGKNVIYIMLEARNDNRFYRLFDRATHIMQFATGTDAEKIIICLDKIKDIDLIIIDSIDLIGASSLTCSRQWKALVEYCFSRNIGLCVSKQMVKKNHISSAKYSACGSSELIFAADSVVGLELNKINAQKAEMKVSLIKDKNRGDWIHPLSAKFKVDLEKGKVEC